MQITIITIGTRGDVQPFIALGLKLKAVGYTVKIATTLDYQSFIGLYGLDFVPLRVDLRRIMQTDAGRAIMDPGRNMVRSLLSLNQVARAIIGPCLEDAWQACQQTDVVIVGAQAVLLTVNHIWEILGVPCFIVRMQPAFCPTSEFAPPTIPPYPGTLITPTIFSRAYNRLMYQGVQQLFWQPLRPTVNRWRHQCLNLPSLPLSGPYRAYAKQKLPTLYAYSARVVPRPADWPAWHHVTGYWFLEASSRWQPSPQLLDFLAAGPPPLCVSFGSTLFRHTEPVTDTILQAIAQTGHRAILLSGWGGLQATDLPPSIIQCQSVPYDWLFPQVSAVIHHGGAGTSAAALNAGIPSISIPVFADHAFWAQRVAQLGLGTIPIPRTHLTVSRLVAAIETVTQHTAVRKQVAAFQPVIQAEQGVDRAVRIIQEYLVLRGLNTG